MAFDGVVTRAVAKELDQLVGGRISRIHQPFKTDLVFNIRAKGGNQKLLLSANPTYPRVHLTTEEFTNPSVAPMFCMLLRKYCEGGVIESISQLEMERILHIDVKSRDELGDLSKKRIIVEIMGRHSNIILVDPETNTILDSVMHVTHGISQYRQVLPGRSYIEPPSQGKQNPLTITDTAFTSLLNWNAGKLDKQLVDLFSGISPLLAKEIIHRAGLGTRDKVWAAFHELVQEVIHQRYQPTIVQTKDKTVFSITPLTHVADGEVINFDSISECLQTFYEVKAQRDQIKQKVYDLIRLVTNEKQKNEKKIEKLKLTLQDAQDADQFRLYGELITANMHQLKRGDHELVTVNWYDENAASVSIPLDPLKTPSENLQSYYKRYNKAKNSMQIVEEQITLAQEEILYLDTILVQLEYATVTEAAEIREELVEQGYLRNRQKRTAKKKKDLQPEIEVYTSSDGIPIYVGKNNKQNDYLTNKLANGADTWLHAKDIPGSHVVIRSREIPDQTLLEAANLAAYFSKSRQGSLVPIDYTLVKYVKKPSGAKPGFVIYDNQRTLYVTPEEAQIRTLRSQGKA
ncbi:Rqc2 family fibronectin-binding protein [Brevibacillus ginsengisoli]|uniref:Rqc2 family fibronectin-binding protein n=1 Tax=Brevibacillus ginsengisoli TaxID=363854 RepID=UPI003CE9B777